MYQDITYSIDNGIAVITINRPKVLNAIRIQTYDDLIDALNSSDQNDDVKILVLTGAEGRFTAGNDLSDLLPPSDIRELKKRVGGIFEAFARLSKPLIIAQEGVAVGIGANMLLHADIAYAGKSIRYSLPFARIGVTSEGACSVLLAEAIGPKRANELLYSGRFFSAEEAEKWGLLTAMVDDGQALETAMNTARELLKNSQDSIRAIKQLGKAEGHEARVNKAVELEMEMFGKLLDTPETQARIQHVLKGGK